ncbi:MAG: FKBP-type peptidyl-prolyl cis-trans isomerase, partial [Bacteroidota bacterium]
YRIAIIVFAIAGMLLSTACTEETGETDNRAKEQRKLDIYMAYNYPDATPLASGLYYIEESAGVGESPDTNDWVLVNHVCYRLPDDIVYESYIENVAEDNNLDPSKTALYGAYKMQNGTRNAGLTEGLSLMKEGGEATLAFHSDLGYGSSGNGTVGQYTSLKYEIELLEVIPDIEAYELAKIAAYIDTVAVYDTIHDPETDAILYYIIDEATDSALVGIDSTISVAYKGYLTDGRVFDESVDGTPLAFKVGDPESTIIKGWHLGLEKFKEGEKGRLVIPWQLAYGEEETISGSLRTMPPYETLVFDVEILSVEAGGDDDDPGQEE